MTTIGLVFYRRKPLDALRPLRERALLAEASLQGAAFILLDPSYYDPSRELIRAYVWRREEGWSPEVITLPDVIIIIGSINHDDQRPLDQWIRSARPVIADVGHSKLKLNNLFSKTAIEKHLIPCFRIPKEQTQTFLYDLLKQERSGLVVKRTTANRGVGLLFAVRLNNQQYCVKYNNTSMTGSVEEAAQYLHQRIAGRLQYRDYIVQSYIHSSTSDGRPFDIRIHVQRRGDHEWHVTRGYVRLAEIENPLPNTSKGGYQGSLESFLEKHYPLKALQIKEELYDISLEIAKVQSLSVHLPLSELGIDFVLDEAGKIWLIETNTLPETFLHEHQRAVHVIEYALSLVR